MKNLLLLLGLIAVSLSLAIPSQALADVISINMAGGRNIDGEWPMGAQQLAGVVPAANWNNAMDRTNGSMSALKTGVGATTTASITWDADGSYDAGGGSPEIDPTDSGDHLMLMARLEGYGATPDIEVTVSGLPTSFQTSGYDVYVYCDRFATDDETDPARFPISGYTIGAETYWTDGVTNEDQDVLDPVITYVRATGGVFDPTPGGNYALFEGLTGASFDLEAQAIYRSQINGIQIVTIGHIPDVPGDLDGDGFVGVSDLDIVKNFWGQTVDSGDKLSGDPSNDGFCGIEDADIVRRYWGSGTPPGEAASAVPEPASLAMLVLGGLVLLARRHRSRV